MSFSRRQHTIVFIATALVAALPTAPFLVPPASAATKHTTLPPICRPAQLRPSMSPSHGTYSASSGFRATLWFEDTGARCTLTVDNVPVEGVSGPSHVPVGVGSVSGAVGYPPMVLSNGDRAYATVSIGSISTGAFKKLVREHGSSCDPKYADGLEVESNAAVRDDSWPSHYFALPERVPICTKDYFNVAAAVIQKASTASGPASPNTFCYPANRLVGTYSVNVEWALGLNDSRPLPQKVTRRIRVAVRALAGSALALSLKAPTAPLASELRLLSVELKQSGQPIDVVRAEAAFGATGYPKLGQLCPSAMMLMTPTNPLGGFNPQ
jgi:hypothetical protein